MCTNWSFILYSLAIAMHPQNHNVSTNCFLSTDSCNVDIFYNDYYTINYIFSITNDLSITVDQLGNFGVHGSVITWPTSSKRFVSFVTQFKNRFSWMSTRYILFCMRFMQRNHNFIAITIIVILVCAQTLIKKTINYYYYNIIINVQNWLTRTVARTIIDIIVLYTSARVATRQIYWPLVQ